VIQEARTQNLAENILMNSKVNFGNRQVNIITFFLLNIIQNLNIIFNF